jgi:hypothetical protein
VSAAGNLLRLSPELLQFMRKPIVPDLARKHIEGQLRARQSVFLRNIGDAVFARPNSPYARLLNHAGIDFERVTTLVSQYGVEPTLERLYAAGVFISIEQFKHGGLTERPGLAFEVTPADFDNPLARGFLRTTTSGSRAAARRIDIDLG